MSTAKKVWPGTLGNILSWFGTLPFIIATIICFTKFKIFVWPFLVVIISTYAAMIVTFVAGSHWGMSATLDYKKAKKIMISSNVITLLAWAGILFPSWIVSWSIILVCYWLAFLMDRVIFLNGGSSMTYLKMRLYITVFVSLSLLIMMYLGRSQLWS